MQTKHKIGILVDDNMDITNLKSQIDFQSSNYIITHIFKQNSPYKDMRERLIGHLKRKRLISALFFTISVKIDLIISHLVPGICRSERKKNKLKVVDNETNDPEQIFIKADWSTDKIYVDYSPDAIRKIKETGIVALVRCNTGIMKGAILNALKYGIISLHHGDNRFRRGGPPGFWEVFYREPITGFIVQRLSKELDGGRILMRGSVRTQMTYSNNRKSVVSKSKVALKKVLNNLDTINNELPQVNIFDGQIDKKPNLVNQIKYFVFLLKYITSKLIMRLTGRSWRWQIGYFESESIGHLYFPKMNVMFENDKGFRADPFVFEYSGEMWCFYEKYNYSRGKGEIYVTRMCDNSAKEYLVLTEDYHVSFPYLFFAEEEIYMLVESSQNLSVNLYACDQFPMKWRLVKELLKGQDAADPMIVKHNGKWWLFVNIDSNNSADHCSELHIFHSENLRDKWQSHEKNPVIFDATCARNGGLIFENSELYRIGQAHGFDNYGEGVSIRKITDLRVDEYQEVEIGQIRSNFRSDALGIHTLNRKKKLNVFDFSSR